MSETPITPFDHKAAIEHLSKADKRLAKLISHLSARAVEFRLNIEDAQTPYESLLRAIVFQSISTKAARAIFARVQALGTNGRCPTPKEILLIRKQKLRRLGLSGAKADAVRDLARKTIEGVVPTLEEAHKMSDQDLVHRLISVRGIGPWTVEMFLIFRLGRPDVLPVHDYGVQKGFAITYRKKTIPRPRELAAFGERWRPYRTVASWYMWRAIDHAGKNARKITKPSAKRGALKNHPVLKQRLVVKKVAKRQRLVTRASPSR